MPATLRATCNGDKKFLVNIRLLLYLVNQTKCVMTSRSLYCTIWCCGRVQIRAKSCVACIHRTLPLLDKNVRSFPHSVYTSILCTGMSVKFDALELLLIQFPKFGLT